MYIVSDQVWKYIADNVPSLTLKSRRGDMPYDKYRNIWHVQGTSQDSDASARRPPLQDRKKLVKEEKSDPEEGSSKALERKLVSLSAALLISLKCFIRNSL